MDCVSVGPWTLQWWQRRMAVLCILLLHQLSAIVQLVQPVWGLPCPSKKFVKASPWKVLPVAVSEYVKSWMLDTPEAQPRSRTKVQWITNRPVVMRPSARAKAKLWTKFQALQEKMDSLRRKKVKGQETFQ